MKRLSLTSPLAILVLLAACGSSATSTGVGTSDEASPAPVDPGPVVETTGDGQEPPADDPSTAVPPAATGYAPPESNEDADGNLVYVDPPSYDASGVVDLAPGTATPEAAVVTYLASRIRGDERYREVMVADCERRCQRGLAEHDTWTFLEFRLVSRGQEQDRLYFKAWFKITYEGDEDEGTDDFTLIRENGEWRIAEVPT